MLMAKKDKLAKWREKRGKVDAERQTNFLPLPSFGTLTDLMIDLLVAMLFIPWGKKAASIVMSANWHPSVGGMVTRVHFSAEHKSIKSEQEWGHIRAPPTVATFLIWVLANLANTSWKTFTTGKSSASAKSLKMSCISDNLRPAPNSKKCSSS